MPPPLSALHCSLAVMASITHTLIVSLIIRAALRPRYDVVNHSSGLAALHTVWMIFQPLSSSLLPVPAITLLGRSTAWLADLWPLMCCASAAVHCFSWTA